MSRRQFLGYAAAAASLRWQLGSLAATEAITPLAILDLGQHCSLGESLTGYAAALGVAPLQPGAASPPRCAVLIVPGTSHLPTPALNAITTCLAGGGVVMLESGAGFASPVEFASHQALLRETLDIHVEPPVALWPESGGSGVPYVDFTWPIRARVRDFSRVVPVASEAGETIAGVQGYSAAIKRRRGRGTLVVLGSPLGPALWAGDAEAVQWLYAATAHTTA